MEQQTKFAYYYYKDIVYPEKDCGIACASLGTPKKILPSSKEIHIKTSLMFFLEDGEYSDYMANDRGLFLCSPKLMEIIESNKSLNDGIQWMKIAVQKEGKEQRPYFAMFFLDYLDALDEENTKFTETKQGKIATYPILSKEKIGNHKIFMFDKSWREIFSENLKQTIELENCTGIVFGELVAI